MTLEAKLVRATMRWHRAYRRLVVRPYIGLSDKEHERLNAARWRAYDAMVRACERLAKHREKP